MIIKRPNRSIEINIFINKGAVSRNWLSPHMYVSTILEVCTDYGVLLLLWVSVMIPFFKVFFKFILQIICYIFSTEVQQKTDPVRYLNNVHSETNFEGL